MVNECLFIGKVKDDFQLKTAKNGNEYCDFTIVINEKLEFDGKPTDLTTFQRINCWNRLAKQVATQFQKGSEVIVKGSITNSNFQGKVFTKIRARSVESLA